MKKFVDSVVGLIWITFSTSLPPFCKTKALVLILSRWLSIFVQTVMLGVKLCHLHLLSD